MAQASVPLQRQDIKGSRSFEAAALSDTEKILSERK